MEPIALASLAIRLLQPVFGKIKDSLEQRAADGASEAASTAVGNLYALVRRKLSGDKYDEGLLDGVEADPSSASRQRNLEQRLGELIEQDPDFAKVLAELVNEAEPGSGTKVTAVNSGITSSGSITQIGGRDATGRDHGI